mgnify:FL=1
MAKIIISTENSPSAIGPYSQAVCVGGLTFTSGQIPLDPYTGNLVSENFEDQAIQTLKNIKGILLERNRTLNDIVKLTVYLVDLSNFNKLNRIFKNFFKDDYPARSVIEVSKLPKNAKIEIEAIFIDEV